MGRDACDAVGDGMSGYIVTGKEYRSLAPHNSFDCTKCGKRCSTWSWDNEDPYSNCCHAPIKLARTGGRIYYKGEAIEDGL